MTEIAQTLPAPMAAPVPYLTLHPREPNYEIARLATAHVGGWGTYYRNPGEPIRTFVVTIWGQMFDAAETLAEIDAAMGFVG